PSGAPAVPSHDREPNGGSPLRVSSVRRYSRRSARLAIVVTPRVATSAASATGWAGELPAESTRSCHGSVAAASADTSGLSGALPRVWGGERVRGALRGAGVRGPAGGRQGGGRRQGGGGKIPRREHALVPRVGGGGLGEYERIVGGARQLALGDHERELEGLE